MTTLSTSTLIAALLLPSLASAQHYASPEPKSGPAQTASTQREGMMAGIGLGFGTLALGNESNGTSNYHIQFGGFLTSQWALVVQFWGASHSEADAEQSNLGIGLQHWIGSELWIRAAIGAAKFEQSYEGQLLSRLEGAVVTGGAGWDVYSYQEYHFNLSVDLSVQGYAEVRDNATSIALHIGMQYY